MRFVFLSILFFVFTPPAILNAAEIVAEPICFLVINESEHSINGSIVTDLYTKPDGSQGRHRSNFRLQAAGTNHEEGYPIDRAEFCSYGPFFEGRKLEFTIRTLFPMFSCQTTLESGPIRIQTKFRADDPMGGYDYSATCYD